MEVLMSIEDRALSAAALKITSGEHRALLEIRELFAKGTFKHDPDSEADHPDGFNMNFAEKETKCGTSCCIGGWVWHAMSRHRTTISPTAGHYVGKGHADTLKQLYYPDLEQIDDMSYDDITPSAALVAIDQFLTTGEVDWSVACGLDQSVDLTA
jgi:hypothetical protein